MPPIKLNHFNLEKAFSVQKTTFMWKQLLRLFQAAEPVKLDLKKKLLGSQKKTFWGKRRQTQILNLFFIFEQIKT